MIISAQEAAQRQKDRFRYRAAHPKEVWGIPWGIPKLDRLTGGIARKETYEGRKVGDNELVTIIADTGAGKTSFAGWITQNVGRYFRDYEPDKEVRFATLEYSAENIQDRMAASMSAVPLKRIKTGMYLTEGQKQAYEEAVDDLATLHISYIDEVVNLSDLGNSISKVDPQTGRKPGLWVIDHLHLCPGASNAENGVAALNQVVDGLIRLSKRVPGMVLAQMNKEATRRADKRPQKGDVLNNSTLVQASTLVLGLYREDLYQAVDADQKPNILPSELHILKNRNDQMGMVSLELIADRMLWKVIE